MKQVFFTKKPEALYAITVGWPGTELVIRDIKVPARRPGRALLGRSGRA